MNSVEMSGSGNGGGAMPASISKLFVWPHGGRSVFLTGSFTRWSEFIPMTPKEGCPSSFEAICSLTPGYHQYKFHVDGEWRHDECQPFIRGGNGILNAIHVSSEPDTLPPNLSAEMPGRSLMEIDNNVFDQVEANQRMRESDLQVSRDHISEFLSSQAAIHLIPDIGQVVALGIAFPVKKAFHSLYEAGLFVAPLWDSRKRQFVGMLSAMDFILILQELEIHGSNLTQEQLETYSIAAWREAKIQECGTSNRKIYPQPFVHAGPDERLKDVALKILQNKVATVPILHSTSETGSVPRLLHLASLSGILNRICKHFENSSDSLPILQQPIGSIPIGTWVSKLGESNKQSLAMLGLDASLGDALSLMIQADVSSILIVDDDGRFIDIYTRRDIIGLVKQNLYARISLYEFTLFQALFVAGFAFYSRGLRHGPKCHTCFRSDPLHKVMEKLSNPAIRQLVVVEAESKRVEGIISVGDVFRLFLN